MWAALSGADTLDVLVRVLGEQEDLRERLVEQPLNGLSEAVWERFAEAGFIDDDPLWLRHIPTTICSEVVLREVERLLLPTLWPEPQAAQAVTERTVEVNETADNSQTDDLDIDFAEMFISAFNKDEPADEPANVCDGWEPVRKRLRLRLSSEYLAAVIADPPAAWRKVPMALRQDRMFSTAAALGNPNVLDLLPDGELRTELFSLCALTKAAHPAPALQMPMPTANRSSEGFLSRAQHAITQRFTQLSGRA